MLAERSKRVYHVIVGKVAALAGIQGDLVQAQKAGNGTRELVRLIFDHNLTWEMLPTDALTKPEIWEALLPKMPMTAMIRNLANMTRVGLVAPMSDARAVVCNRLRDEAKRKISLEDHLKATAGVECRKDSDVIDESPAAYKSIDAVMEAQQDLVEVVHTLKQVVCVKG